MFTISESNIKASVKSETLQFLYGHASLRISFSFGSTEITAKREDISLLCITFEELCTLLHFTFD